MNKIVLFLPITFAFSLQAALQGVGQDVNWKEAAKQQSALALDQNRIEKQGLLLDFDKVFPGIATMHFHDFVDAVTRLEIPQKNELLDLAARHGLIGIVRLVLDNGADVNFNYSDEYGHTVLMTATVWEHLAVMQLLLERGAAVNHVDSRGNTALIWAASNKNLACAALLLKHGANVNAVSNDGVTALIKAAYIGNIEMVQLLLAHGADVNHADSNGNTALIMAVSNAHTDIVRFLLKHGAAIDHKNLRGQTARDIADVMIWGAKVGQEKTLVSYVDTIISLLDAAKSTDQLGDTCVVQ